MVQESLNWSLLVTSFVLGSVGAWFMYRFAFRFGLLDVPNDRSSHELPTPRGGGVGILAAFAISSYSLRLPFLFWLPAVFLALVSFFDDKLDLAPNTRLIFQFAAALAVTGSWAFTVHFSLLIPVLILFFSVFLVGTANFYNFMDGINGIAGLTGVVAFGLLGFFAQVYASTSAVALSSFCISAACLGFLPFNMPKAKVFMGDVGSILLGFVFAAYVVLLARNVADFLLLAGFLSTFYADTLSTLCVRKLDRERLTEAHRRHLYQLFANQKRMPHWKVSIVYGIIQAVVGFLLLYAHQYGLVTIIVTEIYVCVVWIGIMVSSRKRLEIR